MWHFISFPHSLGMFDIFVVVALAVLTALALRTKRPGFALAWLFVAALLGMELFGDTWAAIFSGIAGLALGLAILIMDEAVHANKQADSVDHAQGWPDESLRKRPAPRRVNRRMTVRGLVLNARKS